MTVWIALLRAVNVGGNMLKMDRLRGLCGELGWKNVQTYVQSGNVVFEADGVEAEIVVALEAKLTGVTRLPPKVILRSAAELAAAAAANPFLADPGVDRTKLHLTFLDGPPLEAGFAKLAAMDFGVERVGLVGRDLYLHCPEGFGTSKLAKVRFEKLLARDATTRNWNSVAKLLELSSR